MGTPFRSDLLHLLRCGPFAFAVGALNRVLNSEIELRQYVGTAESEHEEHLRGPAADALDLNQVFDEFVIGQGFDVVERQRAAGDFGREIAEVPDLLAGQADGAERFVARREHRFGGGFALDTAR